MIGLKTTADLLQQVVLCSAYTQLSSQVAAGRLMVLLDLLHGSFTVELPYLADGLEVTLLVVRGNPAAPTNCATIRDPGDCAVTVNYSLGYSQLYGAMSFVPDTDNLIWVPVSRAVGIV